MIVVVLSVAKFSGLAISDAKIKIYFFQTKSTEAILSNSTRKLLWVEISEILTAV